MTVTYGKNRKKAALDAQVITAKQREDIVSK